MLYALGHPNAIRQIPNFQYVLIKLLPGSNMKGRSEEGKTEEGMYRLF